MKKIDLVYEGDLRCKTFNASQPSIITDAPLEFNGREEAISPVELIVAALGSCMLTIMAIAAKKNGIDIKGSKLEGDKEMAAEPERRIKKIMLNFYMAGDIPVLKRKILEQAAYSCPVRKSLHPEIQYEVAFKYLD